MLSLLVVKVPLQMDTVYMYVLLSGVSSLCPEQGGHRLWSFLGSNKLEGC